MEKASKVSVCSLLCNIAFSAYHLTLGHFTGSRWLLTLGVYYLTLSIVRFFVLKSRHDTVATAVTVGALLLALSLPLAGIVILAAAKDRGHQLHEILMITMATYSFAKISVAAVNFIKSRRSASFKLIALRNISLANAFVSIFALQRSMLVSFGDMNESDILLFNILTGSAVWLIVLFLGINLIRKSKNIPQHP